MPGRELAPESLELCMNLCTVASRNAAARQDDDIQPGEIPLVTAKTLAREALDAIAIHGAGQLFFRDGQTQARMLAMVGARQQGEIGVADLERPGEDAPEISGCGEPVAPREAFALLGVDGTPQTDRRLRPLARRAFSTLRPPRVLMRARNPWVRARLILLG